MALASLFISARDWIYPALGIFGFAFLVLIWSYGKAPASPSVRLVCLSLKTLGLAALALCLIDPLWNSQRVRPGANFFVVLADNSAGMQIKDRSAGKSRGEWMRDTLQDDQTAWQKRLAHNFQIRRYFFDGRLQPSKDFSDLTFTGKAAALKEALHSIAERFQNQPLAGVLLFTDGNATDLSGDTKWERLPPIYPVVVGGDDPPPDVAIQQITVSQTSFEDAPVTIQAQASARGYGNVELTGRLSRLNAPPASAPPAGAQDERPARAGGNPDDQSSPAAAAPATIEQTQSTSGPGRIGAFRFPVRPDRHGLTFYEFDVAAQGQMWQLTDTNRPAVEATLANNRQIVVVNRGKGPYRILYVAGRPNWEFKFLNRALTEDDQLQMSALIRVAKREPKFQFRGRAGETSNPLFRGSEKQGEEAERYDQPVLVPLVRNEDELRGGFPKTAEELYGYDAVVVDDLEAEFFTHDQMTLLEKFVSERGGGFLMLGGQESFHQGHYERTPIAALLPVYLDGVRQQVLNELHLNLTREGWLQPWVRLRTTETEERDRLSGMPSFDVLNEIRGIKPGASVLATVSDPSGTQHPALVVQRFGHGRSGALLIGDLWRWGFRDEERHVDFNKAWRQMMRWLVADVPNRVEFQIMAKPGDPNQAVWLQVRVRNKKFEPLDNAGVSIEVRPFRAVGGETNSIHFTAEPSLSEPGLYQALYVPRDEGAFAAEAIVTDPGGAEVGRAQAGWASDLTSQKFRSLVPNRALLESIARKTGGRVIEPGNLDDFAETSERLPAPVKENWSYPVWHQPAFFLFALGCFVGEWGIRRWKGLT